MKTEIQFELDKIIDETTLGVERVLAGENLGKLGDPRKGVGLGKDGTPDIVLGKLIRAGNHEIGSTEENSFGFFNELPRHNARINSFQASIYPVTNTQFASFTTHEYGWVDDRWWSEHGLKWRNSKNVWKNGREPENYPCVNVSWYAAHAFTNWFTFIRSNEIPQTMHFRLLTEPEWEIAARGTTSNLYPWGNTFEVENCNNLETGFGKVCAVGLFPHSATKAGLQDLAGNTWEWCLSLSKPYPFVDDSNKISTENKRVIRGGSYKGNAEALRSAIRREDPPEYGGSSITFRVAYTQKY